MRRFLLLLLFVITTQLCSAQEVMVSDSSDYHSPKRATWLSVVLPGAGQVYNKKYWKLPILYGGFGLSAYYLDDNLSRIKLYRQSLINIQDDDPGTVNLTNFNQTVLTQELDRYKRLRDISYICIAGIYVLQIVDANVDAHMFHFDVSDDLSIMAMPYAGGIETQSAGVYLSLNF